MRQLILIVFLIGNVLVARTQEEIRASREPVIAKASIIRQEYCRGDADLFTVSLKLSLEIVNSSKTPVYLLWPMVPMVGKVAASAPEAEVGRFLYEITASHYPQGVTRFNRLKIEPGKEVTVQTGYDLVARHDPAFSYPKSLSAGTFNLVLVLGPEEEPPAQMQRSGTLKSITTEPLLVEIPTAPKLVSCETSPKAQ